VSEPRITAIMPVKNYHPGYLREAIASVTTQSTPAWRLVIVVEPDDEEMFRTLLARDLEDPRVEVIANRGRKLAGAVNSGMRHAHTEFVALLLADDRWSKDAVQVLLEYIATHPNADFLHSSRMIIDEKGAAISPVYASRSRFELEEFKRGSPVKHLLCWRREKGLAVGGLDESLNSVGPDDYDFPWTMAANGAKFQAVSECLYYYRNHCECYRLTTHLPRSVHGREVDRILRKHGVGVWERLKLRVARRRGAVGEQCLYRSPIDRWIKDKLGYDARRGWRQIRYR
jgi:glycosyltransferase involved in cell wall biosynthesis